MRLRGYGWLAGAIFLFACGDESDAPKLLAGVWASEVALYATNCPRPDLTLTTTKHEQLAGRCHPGRSQR